MPPADDDGNQDHAAGTGLFRQALRDQIDGSRIAVRAALVANDAIKQTWNETLQRSFLGGETPFLVGLTFSGGGQLSIEDQYKVAQSVWTKDGVG